MKKAFDTPILLTIGRDEGISELENLEGIATTPGGDAWSCCGLAHGHVLLPAAHLHEPFSLVFFLFSPFASHTCLRTALIGV